MITGVVVGAWLLASAGAVSRDPSPFSVTTVRVFPYPTALAINPVTAEVFVVAPTGFLTIVDGVSHRTGAIRIAHGIPPLDYPGSSGIAVDPSRNRIYVSNSSVGSLSILHRVTDQIFDAAGGPLPGKPVVDAVSNTVYVPQPGYFSHTGLGADTIRVVAGETLESHDVGVGTRPVAIAVDETRNLVWVANAGDMLNPSRILTMLDGETGGRTDIELGSNPVGVAVDSNRGLVIVAEGLGFDGGPTALDLVDETTLRVSHLTLPPGTGLLQQIVVDPATAKAYVSTFSPYSIGALLEVDETSGKIFELPMSAAVGSIAIDVARHRIYATHPGSDPDFGHTVSVMDGATHEVVEVEVGRQPRDIAVNPVDGTAWTANYVDGTVSVIFDDTVACVRCPRIVPPR